MRNSLLTICLVVTITTFGQESTNQIEVTPYLRWDFYPKFSYAINPSNSNTVKIKGSSWGINGAYKIAIKKGWFIKGGLGYYKYSFNKIDQNNSVFGKNDYRYIQYDPPDQPRQIYSTSKYWYNTIVANIEIERQTKVNKDLSILFGLGIGNYLTFSQYYYILSAITSLNDYKRSESRYFGISANLFIGPQWKLGKLGIGPKIILPVFDNWKKDEVFPQEENNRSRNKWFGGIGAGISLNYFLHKSHKNEK